MQPTIGRVVIVRNLEPVGNNGATEAPALLTRVWQSSGPGVWTVNLKVITDGPQDVWLTSVYLADNEQGLEEIYRRSTIDKPVHAIWPPRSGAQPPAPASPAGAPKLL